MNVVYVDDAAFESAKEALFRELPDPHTIPGRLWTQAASTNKAPGVKECTSEEWQEKVAAVIESVRSARRRAFGSSSEEGRHRQGLVATVICSVAAVVVSIVSIVFLASQIHSDRSSARAERLWNYKQAIYQEEACKKNDEGEGFCWYLPFAVNYRKICHVHCRRQNDGTTTGAAVTAILNESLLLDTDDPAFDAILNSDGSLGLSYASLIHQSFPSRQYGAVNFEGSDLRCSYFGKASFKRVSFHLADLAGAQMPTTISARDAVDWSGARCPDGTVAPRDAPEFCWAHLKLPDGKIGCCVDEPRTHPFYWANKNKGCLLGAPPEFQP